MAQLFRFEEDFAATLHCIPMAVRLKLDSCGIKLKLTQWNNLSPEYRQILLSMPCDRPAEYDRYREFLQNLLLKKLGETAPDFPIEPHPPWLESDRIPDEIQTQARRCDRSLTLEQWQKLSLLQRFALLKLSQSNHENRNFLPAWQEFIED